MKQKIKVGGMALSNGVMMRSSHFIAIAIRTPYGIRVFSRPLKSLKLRYKFLGFPFIRGFVILIEVILLAFSSYRLASKIRKKPKLKLKEKIKSASNLFWSIFYLLLIVGIFQLISLKIYEVEIFRKVPILFNLSTSFLLIVFFFTLILIFFQTPQNVKLFSYHGAEHKVINAYEKDSLLESHSVKNFSRLHPRCGSILAALTLFLSSFFLIFLPQNLFFPIYFLFVILIFSLSFSFSFELILVMLKFKDSLIGKIFFLPLLGFQALFTREPTSDQIKVAIAALKEVLKREELLTKGGKNGKRD